MATRIVLLGGHETTVTETEEEVVRAVRRDHPNPVKLEGLDGLVVYVKLEPHHLDRAGAGTAPGLTSAGSHSSCGDSRTTSRAGLSSRRPR